MYVHRELHETWACTPTRFSVATCQVGDVKSVCEKNKTQKILEVWLSAISFVRTRLSIDGIRFTNLTMVPASVSLGSTGHTPCSCHVSACSIVTYLVFYASLDQTVVCGKCQQLLRATIEHSVPRSCAYTTSERLEFHVFPSPPAASIVAEMGDFFRAEKQHQLAELRGIGACDGQSRRHGNVRQSLGHT